MPQASITNEGLFRFSGMYGSAWQNGLLLAEVIECSGNAAVNRIDVPLVGSAKMGHKRGRETREGTLRVQKYDTKWEMYVYKFLSQNLAQRRAARDAGLVTLPTFQLMLEYDDPDALGIEKWQLDDCMIWQLPIGFSIGDDVVERDYPFTWETETPLYAFEVALNGQDYVGSYYAGYAPAAGVH